MRPLLATTLVLGLALGGCGGGDDPDPATAPATSDASGGATLQLVGTDGLAFEPEQATVTAGEVTVELTAEPAVQHNVVIEGLLDDQPLVEAAAGETATGSVSLEAGSYTLYCGVPGHREAGMQGTVEVVNG